MIGHDQIVDISDRDLAWLREADRRASEVAPNERTATDGLCDAYLAVHAIIRSYGMRQISFGITLDLSGCPQYSEFRKLADEIMERLGKNPHFKPV